MDYELTLFDRLEVIKATNQKYDLEHNAYLSFSGGKDSTILHHLLDMALPNNRIPRVFIDTGIEYTMIREFVMELAKNDDRFVIIKPSQPIRQMLERVGYPFKSKRHSEIVENFQRSGLKCRTVRVYLGLDKTKNGNEAFRPCPKSLACQFKEGYPLKISRKCCDELKKKPVHKWAKKEKRHISILGLRADEGIGRKFAQCILTDKQGNIKQFSPLVKVNEEWENEFVRKNLIEVCELYKPPYNFKRTGCCGCPYDLHLKDDLEIMDKLLPNQRKQAEIIWKPVYDEYRRLGYRLKKVEQIKLFDD